MAHLSIDADVFSAARRRGGYAKRALDICGALGALIVAAPVMMLIWAALALAPGPTIFAQTRVGEGGRRFACLKFRTMIHGAEASAPTSAPDWNVRQKLPDDPRVTRFGRVLRRWGLDELPQLFNVLRGDMSLVGPRPIIPPETPGYPCDSAYARSAAFAVYASVRPGITGLWQVNGGAETPHDHRVRMDIAYVRTRSFALDIRILLATPVALIRRRYG